MSIQKNKTFLLKYFLYNIKIILKGPFLIKIRFLIGNRLKTLNNLMKIFFLHKIKPSNKIKTFSFAFLFSIKKFSFN